MHSIFLVNLRSMEKKTIDHLLRSTWQAIARMYNEEASKYDSTMATGFALLSIDPKKGTPSTALGPKMGMEPRSLTRMIKSLEEKGWIEKRMDKSDKRMVNIHLTETGKKMRNLSRSSVIKFNKTIQEKINKSELKTCFKVLGEINQLIDNNKIF